MYLRKKKKIPKCRNIAFSKSSSMPFWSRSFEENGNVFPYCVHSAKLIINVTDSIKQRADKLGCHGFKYAASHYNAVLVYSFFHRQQQL